MKSFKILLFVSFCSISSIAESQLPPPPPPATPSTSGKVNKADSLVNEGNIQGAIEEYKKLYDTNPGNAIIAYNYACVLSRGNLADTAFRYLSIAVKSNPSAAALIDADLLNLREDKLWTDFENNLVSLLNKKNGYAI